MMKIRNWFRKVTRNRSLRRIDRLMSLSDMKLGKKTRKYFKRLRRSLNINRLLLNLSDRIHNLGEFKEFNIGDFISYSMMCICVSIIGSAIVPIVLVIIIILVFVLPILVLFGKIFLLIFTTSPDDYDWPARYKSQLTHTGAIGKVMNRIWKNNDSYFEVFNQMTSMNMNKLNEPKYWSDEDYGRFMRIILSYAFIYESADGYPDKDILSEFINSDEIQNTAREVLNDVLERKRILDADTSVDTSTEESSSIADNPDPVIVSQTNDRTDSNIIRSEDIQSRIVGKTDRLHNILDSEMQIEK